jgi:hypothetical protein
MQQSSTVIICCQIWTFTTFFWLAEWSVNNFVMRKLWWRGTDTHHFRLDHHQLLLARTWFFIVSLLYVITEVCRSENKPWVVLFYFENGMWVKGVVNMLPLCVYSRLMLLLMPLEKLASATEHLMETQKEINEKRVQLSIVVQRSKVAYWVTALIHCPGKLRGMIDNRRFLFRYRRSSLVIHRNDLQG